MTRPSGAHVHGADPMELVAALAVVAAVGALVWFLLSIIWILAVIAAVFIPAAIYGLVWLAKHGADVAVVQRRALPSQPRAALPARQATPIAARPVQALPAPQHVHYHVHIEQREIEGR